MVINLKILCVYSGYTIFFTWLIENCDLMVKEEMKLLRLFKKLNYIQCLIFCRSLQ